MAAKREKNALNTLVIRILIICVVVIVGEKVLNYMMPERTDVTGMVNMETEELEAVLDISMTRNSDMVKKVNQYSEGEVTVDSDSDIGVVYIDGKQTGLHIHNRKYYMYNVHLGDAKVNVEDQMTYEYEERMTVVNDEMEGYSTAVFYYNSARGDCLVVIYNDYSNRVVALTYFNNLSKVTESLQRLF